MPFKEGHLTDEDLRAYVTFRMAVVDGRTVSEHLRCCRECNDRYRSIAQGRPAAPPVPENVEATEEETTGRAT